MTNANKDETLMERIGHLLAVDPACNGRVTAATLRQIAALSPPASQEKVTEALQLARPIVEGDLHEAIDHNDADWEGMSRTALEAIDAALSTLPHKEEATPATTTTERGRG